MFRIVFYGPEIPPNTGNAIRLAANTGCELHLIRPLGFSLETRQLRRAGLDYHDLADVHVHEDLAALWSALPEARAFAFTAAATRLHSEIAYAPGDLLLFGPESTGLPTTALENPRVTERVALPMVGGSRSLNLANAAAVAVYEAWRQHGFAGSA